jgi:hypothetical protein
MNRWCGLAALCATALCLSGCGSPGPTLHPVSGSCTFDGKPCEGATVVLQRVGGEAGTPVPSGTVTADGTFTVTTHPHGAGAPPGEYVVLVSWYPADGRSLGNPKNKLPAKYEDPGKTPLPKVTIKPGPNDLGTLALTR